LTKKLSAWLPEPAWSDSNSVSMLGYAILAAFTNTSDAGIVG
jgi:hypothetical protein